MSEQQDTATITGYHAHVYYDEETKPIAARVREAIEAKFEVRMGRWHDRPIGPHPRWSYQVAFEPALFPEIVPWLMLNREGLTVFLHPETGDEIPDHRDHPIWFGEALEVDLSVLK
jgi:DOPA 4,5-dioxygenase